MIYFLYKTTNLINNKNYIGIHQTNNLNDGYLGSGLAFKRALKKYGKNNFKREVIKFCSSYEELLDLEKVYVNEVWVKEDSNYNLKTGGQCNGFLSEESKQKISLSLKAKYKSGEITPRMTAPYVATEEQKKQISETLKKRYMENEHNRKGKEPWNKGKKNVQVAWNKGLIFGPLSDDEKKRKSETLKKYYTENEHNRKGKEPWNKGKKNVQVAWNKGIEQPKTECPHCKKMVDKGNGKRWHFENCKLK